MALRGVHARTGADGSLPEEMCLRALLQPVVDVDVDFLVIEGNQPGDWQQRQGWEGIRPREISVQLTADLDRPVLARASLIRARGPRVARAQVTEVDRRAVEVRARREPRLEHQHRR